MIEYLVVGALLGLSAGFAPGPLLALVVAETFRHGIGAGIRVALAPLLTDLPIVAVALVILARLTRNDFVLGIVALAGAGFVLYLGYECLRATELSLERSDRSPRSLQKGVLVNFLSPHPYLFWLTVGGPTTLRASTVGPWAVAAFVGAFYACLVGSKVLVAGLAGRAGERLRGPAYPYVMRALGLGLVGLALLLVRDAGRLWGVW